MDSTQVDSRRTITFTTAQRRLDKIKDSATIFSVCAPRKFVSKPTETELLDTKTKVDLPDRLSYISCFTNSSDTRIKTPKWIFDTKYTGSDFQIVKSAQRTVKC